MQIATANKQARFLRLKEEDGTVWCSIEFHNGLGTCTKSVGHRLVKLYPDSLSIVKGKGKDEDE